jgi:hypothetical protein
MPKEHQFTLSEEDLSSLKAAQKLIRDNLDGQDLPLEVLVSVAVRTVNANEFAREVLSSVTGKEFSLQAQEAGT